MNRVRVFIATTEGPVAVQKITAEDPDVPSVACRDGTTEVLAISRDYTRFVARGTGLVAALTGHGAYRLDLDRPVDGGRSWQLPVLLAHLLEAEGRLAGPDEPADLTLIATGEVDRDQRVRRVGRIPEKLAAASDLVARHREGGPTLVLLVPAADRTPEIEAALRAAGGTAGATVSVLAWERVMGLAALEAAPAGRPAPNPGRAPGAAASTEPDTDNGAEAGEGALRTAREDTGRPVPEGTGYGSRVAPPDGSGDDQGDADAPAHRPAEPPGPSRDRPTAGPATVPPPPGGAAAARPGRRAKRAGATILLVAAAAGVVSGAAWWNGPRHWETLRGVGDYRALENALQHAVVPFLAERFRSVLVAAAPPPASLVFSLVEQRTADGRPCTPRGFRDADRTKRARLAGTPMPPLRPGFFRSEGGASLCEAVYRIANEGERLVYLYFAARPALSFTAGEAVAPAIRRAAALPPGASLTLDLDLGRFPDRILGADLLILAANSPSPQIRRAFELATDASGDSAERASGPLVLTALPALGLTVKGASHAILR